jgi:glycosyltransferase 2 family protein
MKHSKIISYSLLLIGILVLIVFIKSLSLESIIITFSNVKIYEILVIITITILTIIIKSYRWKFLVKKTTNQKISNWFSFTSIIAGIAAGSITPSRAGEVAKPFMLKTNYGTDISKTISCVFSERGFDLLSLIIFFFIGLLFLRIESNSYNFAKAILIILFILIISILFLFPKKFNNLTNILIKKFSPERIKEKLLNINYNIFSGFYILNNKKVLLVVSVTSIISMILEMIRLYFIFNIFSLNVNFWIVMFAFSASIVFGILTMIPGGIGTTEVSQAIIITNLLPNLKEIDLLKGAIILDRFFAYYLLTGIGAVLLILGQRKKLKRSVLKIENEA